MIFAGLVTTGCAGFVCTPSAFAAQAPKISVSPSSAKLLTSAATHAALTISGSPTPTVSCSLAGAGAAQLSSGTLTYTAPGNEPANPQAVITCTATNSLGSSTAKFTANVATVIPGYAGPIPGSYFGMHVMQPYDWPIAPIGSLGKVPGALWPYLEPTKGHYNWTQLDTFLNLAQAHGISLMYATDGVPPWAAADSSTCVSQPYFGPICSGYVSNIQDWDDFVTALVTRYKGRIQIYELWNEPAHTFTGTVAEMAMLTQHEHDIIRSIDPTATILSPSMVSQGYGYLDTYWSSGGPTDVDAVAIHTYPDPRNDVAESITMSITTTIKSVMAKYGLSAKPIWGTEGSWGPASAGDITDVNLRTAFIARQLLLSWSVGISRFYWYAWDSPNVGTLWTSGTVPTAPALAYEQVRSWMMNATMPAPCSINPGGTAYHAIYTCTLTRSGYRVIAVWDTDGDSTYTAPAGYLHYRDLRGNLTAVPTNHEVTIGLEPILLVNQ